MADPTARDPHLSAPAPSLSRRGVLKAAGILGAGAALGAAPALGRGVGAPAYVRRVGGPAARNLVFMVADGMSSGVPALGDHLGRYTGKGLSALTRLSMGKGVYRAQCSTHCADGVVTDSAAASAAWSTGVKHRTGTLCLTGDGQRLTPLLVRAKQGGRRVGCVTTTTITHATPAGWYASHASRDAEREIGAQLLERDIDVALGGGARYFASDLASTAGRHVVRTRDELAKVTAGSERVLGLFSSKHLSMTLDREPHEPTLSEMAMFALERLSTAAGGGGFVLQIEGGRVDHAAHKNDAAGLVTDFRAFDETVARVVEWVRARNDTLLIITTDHATANPGSTFYGQRGIDGLRRLAEAKHSLEWAFAGVPVREDDGRAASPARQAEVLAQRVKEAVGIALGSEAQRALTRSMDQRAGEDNVAAGQSVGVDPFSAQCVVECVLGSLLANELGVAFISPNHTSDHVELLALGPGAETLPTFQDNTATHDWMTGLLEIARAPE